MMMNEIGATLVRAASLCTCLGKDLCYLVRSKTELRAILGFRSLSQGRKSSHSTMNVLTSDVRGLDDCVVREVRVTT